MLIQLGIINYKLILPFIHPIFLQIRKLIHKNDKTPFFEFFTNYCGYICHGIVYLIILKRSKNVQNTLFNSFEEMPNTIFELIDKGENMNSLEKTNSIKVHVNQSVDNLVKKEKQKRQSLERKKKYFNLLFLAGIYFIPLFLDSYTRNSNQ